MSKTLADSREAMVQGMPESFAVAVGRAYMAGALAALTSDRTRDQLLAECIAFGRSIGTPAERAIVSTTTTKEPA